jgi:PhzF family phenazine biosynthesis protein
MSQSIIQVDSFTDKPFAGNPAGVCVMDNAASEDWMQAVAAEMNLSETAFLYPIEDGYHLRWFTPAAEVEMCGHGTLASAHVLWEEGHLKPDQTARFHAISGLLLASKVGDLIELNFPATMVTPTQAPEGLEAALGTKILSVNDARWDLLVELESEEVVRNLKPDIPALSQVERRAIIVTGKAVTKGLDFVSRMFAPNVGIPEDPVTGSAHCALGPYWMEILGKSEFTAFQASKRGGTVYVTVDGDRVRLRGHAVTVFKAELDERTLER